MTNILDLPPRMLALLVELCETSSVSCAAENLGMSQPAASRALAQLRDAFNDPLMVRAGRGLTPTPAARRRIPEIRRLLKQIEMLSTPGGLEPGEMKAVLRIASTDYGVLSVLAPVVGALQRDAPGVQIDVVQLGESSLSDLLEGRLDLMIYADDHIPAGLDYSDLFEEHHVFLCASSNPLAGRSAITREEIEDQTHVLVTIWGDRSGYVDDGALGGARPGMWIPYFTAAPFVLAHSDMILALPRRAAEIFAASHGFTILPIDPGIEPFRYRLIWASQFADDPVTRWVRLQIINAFCPASDSG